MTDDEQSSLKKSLQFGKELFSPSERIHTYL